MLAIVVAKNRQEEEDAYSYRSPRLTGRGTKKDKRVSTTALRDPSSLDQRECLPLRERVRTGG